METVGKFHHDIPKGKELKESELDSSVPVIAESTNTFKNQALRIQSGELASLMWHLKTGKGQTPCLSFRVSVSSSGAGESQVSREPLAISSAIAHSVLNLNLDRMLGSVVSCGMDQDFQTLFYRELKGQNQ